MKSLINPEYRNLSSDYSIKKLSEYIEQNRSDPDIINKSIKKSIDVITSYLSEVKTIS
jgi:hypothetical protein